MQRDFPLKKYTDDRAKFESQPFLEAEKNTALMMEYFTKIHGKQSADYYQKRFEYLTPVWDNGRRGPHFSYDPNLDSGLIISDDYEVSEEMKIVLVDVKDMLEPMGMAWKKMTKVSYFTRDKFIVAFDS